MRDVKSWPGSPLLLIKHELWVLGLLLLLLVLLLVLFLLELMMLNHLLLLLMELRLNASITCGSTSRGD